MSEASTRGAMRRSSRTATIRRMSSRYRASRSLLAESSPAAARSISYRFARFIMVVLPSLKTCSAEAAKTLRKKTMILSNSSEHPVEGVAYGGLGQRFPAHRPQHGASSTVPVPGGWDWSGIADSPFGFRGGERGSILQKSVQLRDRGLGARVRHAQNTSLHFQARSKHRLRLVQS